MLSPEQRARYDRQLRLYSFGEAQQQRLLDASVLVVGAGGLGSPVLLYLAAAGVGRLGIVDDDVVDLSNLQRQVIHRDRDVGTAKVASAARAVRDLNPDTQVDEHDLRLQEGNARALVGRYDLVVDCTDNFTARYLINDSGFLERVPVVHGSIYRYEGQVTVFSRGEGPCYRCLFPVPPPPGTIPSCAEAGVLGVLPGMVGMVQATESIKLLAGLGESLVGRLLRYEALAMRWSELRLRRDPACPLCGDAPTISEVRAISGGTCEVDNLQRLDPAGYEHLRSANVEHILLDVRGSSEVAVGSIEGCVNIPLSELPTRLSELTRWRDRLIVCVCNHGTSSLETVALLRNAGFPRLANLEGGYQAWRAWERHGRSLRS